MSRYENTSSHIRLALSAAVALVLFLLTMVLSKRSPQASRSSLRAGHLTSIAVACAVLVQVWTLTTWALVLATGPFLVLYAFTPRLRKSFGFRLGTLLWLTAGALFALATHTGRPYWEQMLPVSLLTLSLSLLAYDWSKTEFHRQIMLLSRRFVLL